MRIGCGSCGVMLGLLLVSSTPAVASPVVYQFDVTGTTGPLAGVTAAGNFTVDSGIVPVGDGGVAGSGLLQDLAFTWNGVTYDETTANTGDLFFDSTGALISALFGTNCGALGCRLREGANAWTLSSEFEYAMSGVTGLHRGTVTLRAPSPVTSAVPEPTSVTLLSVGLAGLVASMRARGVRRRS